MIMFSINVDEHLCSATSRKLQNIISNLDFKELLFCLHVLFGCWKFCCKQSCGPVLSNLLTPWTTKEIVLEAESSDVAFPEKYVTENFRKFSVESEKCIYS